MTVKNLERVMSPITERPVRKMLHVIEGAKQYLEHFRIQSAVCGSTRCSRIRGNARPQQ